LSDKGWQKKHTAFYNLPTHIMDKIVENPDPEIGKMHKVEQGKLKIQMSIDWFITAGLLGNKEYKYFYKWAQRFINYHTQIALEDPLLKGYEQFVIKLQRMTNE
jgi:hypothetical protein